MLVCRVPDGPQSSLPERNSYLYVVAQSVPTIPSGRVGRPTFMSENVCSPVLAFLSYKAVKTGDQLACGGFCEPMAPVNQKQRLAKRSV